MALAANSNPRMFCSPPRQALHDERSAALATKRNGLADTESSEAKVVRLAMRLAGNVVY
jgi:hypothetical protein